jgi:hypothetical protein
MSTIPEFPSPVIALSITIVSLLSVMSYSKFTR